MQTAQRTVTKIVPKVNSIIEHEGPVMRIAAYCRVSSDSADQENSFAAQVKYYTEAISKIEGAELADIYADDAVSGRGTVKRIEFNRLLSDCRKGKIDRIITKSVSRFARNTVDCLQTVRMLSELGISVLFEKENIDTAKMPSEVILAMTGVQAQDESISHGNNMRWSYEQRMKNGNFLGTKSAYGYNLINCANATINKEEAAVVRLIANLYLSGMGKQKIAGYLNANGFMYRNSKEWNEHIVSYILNNERYIGDALLQKKITTNESIPRKIRNDGSFPQYYVENCLPSILTREQRQAIVSLQAQRRSNNHANNDYPLSRFLRCSECGHTYRRMMRKNGAVWCCSYRIRGTTRCNIYMIREDDIYNVLINAVNKLRSYRNDIIMPLIERMEKLQSKINGTDAKILDIDREIAKVSRQSLVIAELLSNGILDSADFTSQSNELSAKLSDLRAKRSKCLQQKENDSVITDLKELYMVLDDMDTDLNEYDEETVRAVIEYVTVVSETEIRLYMHGGFEITEYLPKYYTARHKKG